MEQGLPHAGKIITKFNFYSLFSDAWCGGVTPANIIFCRAGVYPLNPQAVTVTGKFDCSLSDYSSSNQSAEPSLPISHYSPGPSTENDEPLGVSVTNFPETVLSDCISASGICVSASNIAAAASFTEEQKRHCFTHYKEGFDVAEDQAYTQWLRLNHPDCPLLTASENQVKPRESGNPLPRCCSTYH